MSVYVRGAQQDAQTCIIWMHGLGADSTDMMGIADQLQGEKNIKHVFIDAPIRPVTLNGGMMMRAWYDIVGMQLTDREDEEGINQSRQMINRAIEEQRQAGFTYRQIVLAGFSQGGAIALHTALNTAEHLGGVIALSAYLPLARTTDPVLDKTTPFFIGSGQFDPIVLPQWTQHSKEWLSAQGYTHISSHLYPMEHSVSFAEINDLSSWISQHLQGELS